MARSGRRLRPLRRTGRKTTPCSRWLFVLLRRRSLMRRNRVVRIGLLPPLVWVAVRGGMRGLRFPDQCSVRVRTTLPRSSMMRPVIPSSPSRGASLRCWRFRLSPGALPPRADLWLRDRRWVGGSLRSFAVRSEPVESDSVTRTRAVSRPHATRRGRFGRRRRWPCRPIGTIRFRVRLTSWSAGPFRPGHRWAAASR